MYMDENRKILLVDDEETLCEVLRFNLESEGYMVDVANSSEEALTMPLREYSLILLDVMMGEISGIQFANILKRNSVTADIPIIFCTARDAEDDMVEGLELGADDYITKPYSVRNILARVKAVLRRRTIPRSTEPLNDGRVEYGKLVIVPSRKLCMVNGLEIKMPRKEFEILSTLMGDMGKVFSREELLRLIWPDEVVVLDRVVDVNITRLRSKLGEYARNIVTRPGYGYAFMV